MTRQNKMLLATLEYPPDIGGVSCYLKGIAENINIQVDVHRVRIPKTGMWPRWLSCVLPLRAVIKNSKPDFIGISHVLPMGYVILLLRLLGVRAHYIVFTHGLDVLGPLESKWKKWWISIILKRAHLIVANSSYTKEIVSLYGIESDRIIVMHPGLSKETINKVRNQHIPLTLIDNPIILSVGRLVRRKGIDRLIEAMTLVHKSSKEARCVIIGQGPDWHRLNALITSKRAGDYIEIVKNVSDDVLHEWYDRAHIFTMTPREINGDVEGFGIVYLEAGLHSLPVIATQSGGVTDAVEHNVSGIVLKNDKPAEIARAILALLNQPEYANKLGSQGRMRALEKFSWDINIKQIEKALNLCTNGVERPLVSIIIPVYNHAKELIKCLESIAQQSYLKLEIIIVDDGSKTPLSIDRPNLPASIKDKITLIHQENKGAPSARNRGFGISKGEYVLFCDADVVMKKDMISEMIKALQKKHDASFVYSSFDFGWKRFHAHEFDYELLKQNNYIHTTSLIERSSFPGFDEELTRFQDWDLWLRMANDGKRGLAIDDALFSVKPRKSGMSAWLPKSAYRFSFLPKVKQYHEAEHVIRHKHGI